MNLKLLTIFCLSVLAGEIFCQQEKVVAKVGSYNICETEFKERYDFSAHPGLIKEGEKQEAKHEFLHQLIAEKLLSLEAKEKGYNNSDIFSNIMTPMENIYIRDALYSIEVKSKTNYTKAEVNEGIERIKKVLLVKFLYSKNENELRSIFQSLNAGALFDSILALRHEAADQVEPRKITFGTVEKEVEDVVYNLKPGEFTAPIKSKDGFYILKLINTENNKKLKDPENTLEDVRRIVETRATHNRYLDYYHNFFTKHKVTADKQIFEKLISIFVPKFREKYSRLDSLNSGGKYFLRGYEISSALENLSSELHSIEFVSLHDNPKSIKYFLNQLSHEGLYVQNPEESSIRASLSSYIRKFIEDELLTIEGKKRNLQEIPEVQKYITMWSDSYLSKMLMMDIFDSVKVSNEDAYQIYQQSGGKPIPVEKVNIIEILTDSLEVIETVLRELKDGKDFKELAKQYTKRDSLKSKGGEYGLFPITKYGEIGKIISQMSIDEVYGPVKLDEGYSIFKLIERRHDKAEFAQEFDEVKDQIIMKVTLNRFENYVNEYTARLAKKYGVEINEKVLDEIENTHLNLVVVRYMGFGGEIFAVPYTEQFSGWYKIWQNNNNINP